MTDEPVDATAQILRDIQAAIAALRDDLSDRLDAVQGDLATLKNEAAIIKMDVAVLKDQMTHVLTRLDYQSRTLHDLSEMTRQQP